MCGFPQSAAWRHLDARAGFEVVFLRAQGSGVRVEGRAVAVEDALPWAAEFSIELDGAWVTRTATVAELSREGRRAVRLEADGGGHWWVNGAEASELDGCFDVDLGASAFTNALPIRRLTIEGHDPVAAPAAYVRAPGLAVERLDQTYTKLPGGDGVSRFAYTAPAFRFEADLTYDTNGLVLDYPGIATRVA